MENEKTISIVEKEELMKVLEDRFHKNKNIHLDIDWKEVQSRLDLFPEKLWSLFKMEDTGGEPDVIGYNSITGEYIFCDCSKESPIGRRSLCYDNQALEARKENKPVGSAIAMAESMGIEILTEEQYRDLQRLGKFDVKTSSWVKTPITIRRLGGAVFCDYRYDTVFLYHNGAESYYGARGFRGILRV